MVVVVVVVVVVTCNDDETTPGDDDDKPEDDDEVEAEVGWWCFCGCGIEMIDAYACNNSRSCLRNCLLKSFTRFVSSINTSYGTTLQSVQPPPSPGP